MDVSNIFYFFLLEGGEGGVRGAGRGGKFGFLLKSQERGGGLQEGRGGRGAGRVSAANWGWGGGAKYFFSGPKCPPRHIQSDFKCIPKGPLPY